MPIILDLIVNFVKVIIAILLAIVCLAIGLWSFGLVTGVDAVRLLRDGNAAVGIVVAGLLVAIAVILGPTIASLKIEKK